MARVWFSQLRDEREKSKLVRVWDTNALWRKFRTVRASLQTFIGKAHRTNATRMASKRVRFSLQRRIYARNGPACNTRQGR